jgi:hypothetical protein
VTWSLYRWYWFYCTEYRLCIWSEFQSTRFQYCYSTVSLLSLKSGWAFVDLADSPYFNYKESLEKPHIALTVEWETLLCALRTETLIKAKPLFLCFVLCCCSEPILRMMCLCFTWPVHNIMRCQRDCYTTSAVVENVIVDFLKTGVDFSSTSSATKKYLHIRNKCSRTHSHTHIYNLWELKQIYIRRDLK